MLILLCCSLSHSQHCNNSLFSLYTVLNLKQQVLRVKVTSYFDVSSGFSENVTTLLIISYIHLFLIKLR